MNRAKMVADKPPNSLVYNSSFDVSLPGDIFCRIRVFGGRLLCWILHERLRGYPGFCWGGRPSLYSDLKVFSYNRLECGTITLWSLESVVPSRGYNAFLSSLLSNSGAGVWKVNLGQPLWILNMRISWWSLRFTGLVSPFLSAGRGIKCPCCLHCAVVFIAENSCAMYLEVLSLIHPTELQQLWWRPWRRVTCSWSVTLDPLRNPYLNPGLPGSMRPPERICPQIIHIDFYLG